jgi:hypothetical protein
MDTIFSLFPDADELLKMQPEDLAPVLLKLALPQLQSAASYRWQSPRFQPATPWPEEIIPSTKSGPSIRW